MRVSVKRQTLAILMAAATPLLCSAVDNVFTGSGAWTEPAFWSLGHIPTTTELAWVNGTATLDTPQTTAGLSVQGSLSLSGVDTALSSTDTILIGCYATNGVVTQTQGRFTAGSYFYVGEQTTGSVHFTDTDVSITNTFVVGHNTKGIGLYAQTGGTLDFRAYAVVSSGGGAVGTMALSNVVMTCTNNNGFTVANATGYFAATNSTLILTDFSVANPAGGAKGYADITGSLVSVRDITSANNTNATGRLRFEACSISARNIYVGREHLSDGWLGFSHSAVTSSAPVYVGEKAGSYGQLTVSQSVANVAGQISVGYYAGSRGQLIMDGSEVETPTVYAGQNAGATGSVTLASGSLKASSWLYAGNNGAGVFSNLSGTVTAANIGVSYTSGTADGYLYCGPGSVTESTGYFQVGRYGNGLVDCYGTASLPSTSLGLFIGNLANARGTFNLYPGARLLVRNQLILGYTSGAGTFNQYGGDVVVSNTTGIAGNNSSYSETQGTYTLHDGTFTACQTVYVGRFGTGVLHVAGGVMAARSSTMYVGSGATAVGELNLTGGRLEAYIVRGNLGQSRLAFDGGTLAAAADRTDFLYGLTAAEVRSGGAILDTDGHNVTVAQSFAHDSRDGAPAKDGGLTKVGDGTSALTGALTFTGDLGANGGTLDVSAATYTLADGAALWGCGTLLPPPAGFIVPSGASVKPGDADGTGTLTVDGDLTLNGDLIIAVAENGSSCGTLAVSGDLTFAEDSTLTFSNPEAFAKGTNYTLVTAGAIAGSPVVTDLPKSWVLKADSHQLRAIYVSGTLVTVH